METLSWLRLKYSAKSFHREQWPQSGTNSWYKAESSLHVALSVLLSELSNLVFNLRDLTALAVFEAGIHRHKSIGLSDPYNDYTQIWGASVQERGRKGGVHLKVDTLH